MADSLKILLQKGAGIGRGYGNKEIALATALKAKDDKLSVFVVAKKISEEDAKYVREVVRQVDARVAAAEVAAAAKIVREPVVPAAGKAQEVSA